jgi:hypothetical protein
VQAGILKRLARLEAKVKVPRLDLSRVSDSDLERIETYFLRLSEVGTLADDFGALPKRLQRAISRLMEVA